MRKGIGVGMLGWDVVAIWDSATRKSKVCRDLRDDQVIRRIGVSSKSECRDLRDACHR